MKLRLRKERGRRPYLNLSLNLMRVVWIERPNSVHWDVPSWGRMGQTRRALQHGDAWVIDAEFL